LDDAEHALTTVGVAVYFTENGRFMDDSYDMPRTLKELAKEALDVQDASLNYID
jgi:hypothetical protein